MKVDITGELAKYYVAGSSVLCIKEVRNYMTKRMINVILCLFMIFGLCTTNIYAYLGDGGYELSANGQYNLNYRINATLLTFTTPNGGDVVRTKGSDGDSEQHFTVYPNDGWIFSHWRAYYEGNTVAGSNPIHNWDSDYRFSIPSDSEVEYVPSDKTIRVNKEWDDSGTYYLYVPSTQKWRWLVGYTNFSGTDYTYCMCLENTLVFDRIVIG